MGTEFLAKKLVSELPKINLAFSLWQKVKDLNEDVAKKCQSMVQYILTLTKMWEVAFKSYYLCFFYQCYNLGHNSQYLDGTKHL